MQVKGIRIVESGWDSRVVDIAGKWILRIARNEWAVDAYAIEARLLPRLAPLLPVQIPVPVRGGKTWMVTRRIGGDSADARAGAAAGEQLASFLQALHAFPVAEAKRLGVRDERRAVDGERFRTLVLPLLDADERPLAQRLLAEHGRAQFAPILTHADLGPEHILVEHGRITGVIDWADTRIGDPAIDLAWPLHGAPPAFAAAVARAYGVGEDLAHRALVHHALAPWHEVVHGLRNDRRWIERGLAGVRTRLRAAAEDAGTMAQ